MMEVALALFTTKRLLENAVSSSQPIHQGIIYLVSHRNVLHGIYVLLYIIVFVPQKMCEAYMLHSSYCACIEMACRNCYTGNVK